MKIKIQTILILLNPVLKNIFRNRLFYIPLILLFVFTFGATWDEEDKIMQIFGLFNLSWLTHSTDSKQAFELYGIDIYVTIWLAWFTLFLPTKVFMHLSKSYTVSQSLWLRFLPLQTIDLTTYRLFFLMFVLIVFGGTGVIWASLYSFVHKISLLNMLIPVLGLAGHLIFSGMIIFLLSSPRSPNLSSSRIGLVFFALILPLLLHAIGKGIAYQLEGFFPFTSPFAAKTLGRAAARPFATTFVIGFIGCMVQWFNVWLIQNQIKKENYVSN